MLMLQRRSIQTPQTHLLRVSRRKLMLRSYRQKRTLILLPMPSRRKLKRRMPMRSVWTVRTDSPLGQKPVLHRSEMSVRMVFEIARRRWRCEVRKPLLPCREWAWTLYLPVYRYWPLLIGHSWREWRCCLVLSRKRRNRLYHSTLRSLRRGWLMGWWYYRMPR